METASGATKHLVIILAILSMKKIMFNDRFGLTQAVLDGTKTMTRRVEKFEPSARLYDEVYNIEGGLNDKGQWIFTLFNKYGEIIGDIIPRYNVGEVVAIAQSYKTLYPNADFEMEDSYNFLTESKGWNNKLFVSASIMPHHIKITDVRMENLQAISDGDCLREGVIKKWHAPACRNYFYVPNVEVRTKDDVFSTPQEAYATLIDKICGKGTWERNPLVWVYEFELID